MRFYTILTRWQNNGTGYWRDDLIRVKATSVRAAVARALCPVHRKFRKGWREPQGADVLLSVTVGERVEKEKP